MHVISFSTISERMNQLGVPLSIGLIALSVLFFALNIFAFSYVIHAIRFSTGLGSFEKTTGKVTNATIEIYYDHGGKKSQAKKYKARIDYSFEIDGVEYFGMADFNSGDIKSTVKVISKYMPDQIIALKIRPEKKFKISPSDLGEYDLFLKEMPFEIKPKMQHASVSVIYERPKPVNHCISLDLGVVSIETKIFSIFLCTVLGSMCAGLLFFPMPTTFTRMGIVALIFLSSIIPAFFIGNPFIQKENVVQTDERASTDIVYELVVDQNNSEANLKEQLRQQKLKYQNEPNLEK